MILKKLKTSYKKIALILSLAAILVWAVLGTGASLAWFVDVSPEVNNIFHKANFDLVVSHRLEDGSWEEIDEKTRIFDDEAIYEPGYVQVVYLKIENKGDREFEFFTAVNVNGCTGAINVFGQKFLLQDFLKFGTYYADTESEMNAGVEDRDLAVALADMPLHNYHTNTAVLGAGETSYLALIVRMPEEVNNVANFRGDVVPRVELGITVKADQIKSSES